MAERVPFPDSLGGAWRRAGLALGDAPFDERTDVLWLQVGTFFADLRVPYEPADPELSVRDDPQAFSGQVRYDPPRLTWTHDLDTMARPSGHKDSAVVERHGSMLFERGEGYIERWQRERPPENGTVLQLHDSSTGCPIARIVIVADLAVGVWIEPVPGGAALVRRRGDWASVAAVGPDDPVSENLSAIVKALRARTGNGNGVLPAGWRQMATT
jgi:hypothetical protein